MPGAVAPRTPVEQRVDHGAVHDRQRYRVEREKLARGDVQQLAENRAQLFKPVRSPIVTKVSTIGTAIVALAR
jgi:hypothetical protein